MSDLLAEVDEAMRQERIEKFFKEHGKTVLGFIAATIILTGALSFYKYWDAKAKETGTDKLIALTEAPDFPENIKTTELDMRGGLRGIALLTAASTFLDQDNAEDALALYQQAANDSGIPNDLRQLATLMSVRLNKDEGADLYNMLAKVYNDKDSPWRFHAHLEAAAVSAHKDSNYAKAREHLNIIQQAEGLPDTLYSKARALDQIYALRQKEQDQKEETDKDS